MIGGGAGRKGVGGAVYTRVMFCLVYNNDMNPDMAAVAVSKPDSLSS